jgi:hypothetical protein
MRRRRSQKPPKSANALLAAIAIMPGLWGAVPVLDIGDHDPSRYMGSDRSMKTWGRLSRNSAAEWSLYGSS